MKERGGFFYSVADEKIKEYRSWSIERRLQWLYLGNQLRKLLPKETVEIQERFRSGDEIGSA